MSAINVTQVQVLVRRDVRWCFTRRVSREMAIAVTPGGARAWIRVGSRHPRDARESETGATSRSISCRACD
jgi:hypothetical protein